MLHRDTSDDARTLHLVMVITGEPPPETVDSLGSLGLQISTRLDTHGRSCHRPWQRTSRLCWRVSGISRTSVSSAG